MNGNCEGKMVIHLYERFAGGGHGLVLGHQPQ